MKNNRKWITIIGAVVLTLVLASALFTASPVFAHGADDAGPAPTGYGQQGPWGSGAVDDCNHAGWGSGMMGGSYGQGGWGSGMMGSGYGQGRWGSGAMGGYGQGGWGSGMAGGYGQGGWGSGMMGGSGR